MITCETFDGRDYYSTTHRGIEYTAYVHMGRWNIHTRRKALGRSNIGSFKFFDTVEEVSANVKAFAGLADLLALGGADAVPNPN